MSYIVPQYSKGGCCIWAILRERSHVFHFSFIILDVFMLFHSFFPFLYQLLPWTPERRQAAVFDVVCAFGRWVSAGNYKNIPNESINESSQAKLKYSTVTILAS